MTRTFLSDADHAALLRLLDREHVDPCVATELLNRAEEAAGLIAMVDDFRAGKVRPFLRDDGVLLFDRVDRDDTDTFFRALAFAMPHTRSAVTSPGATLARSTDPHPLADRTGRASADLSRFDAGVFCAADEHCILDDRHDGEHVYEVGATL